MCGHGAQRAEPEWVHAPVPRFPLSVRGSSRPCCRDSCVPRLGVQHHGSCPRHDAEELIPVLLTTPKVKEQEELSDLCKLTAHLALPRQISKQVGQILPPVPHTGSSGAHHRRQSLNAISLGVLPLLTADRLHLYFYSAVLGIAIL